MQSPEESSPQPGHGGSLFSDSGLQNCEKINICWLSSPICGILSWWPELTKTPTYLCVLPVNNSGMSGGTGIAGSVPEAIRREFNLLLRQKVEFARWRRGEEDFQAEGTAYAQRLERMKT